MAVDIVPILEGAPADTITNLVDGETYYVGRDLRTAPIATPRPATTGAFLGYARVRVPTNKGATLDLSYGSGLSDSGLIFEDDASQRLLIEGLDIVGGYPIIRAPRVYFWHGRVFMDAYEHWSKQAVRLKRMTCNVVKDSETQYTITRLSGDSAPTATNIGDYCQAWGAGLGSTNDRCGTVTAVNVGGNPNVFRCNKNSQNDATHSQNNTTVYVGTSPNGNPNRLYNESRGINMDSVNAVLCGMFGTDLEGMNEAFDWYSSTDAILQGVRTLAGTALYDPTDVEHGNCASSYGNRGSLRFQCLNSYLEGRINLKDYEPDPEACIAAHRDFLFSDCWHDGGGIAAYMQFHAGAFAPNSPGLSRGIFGALRNMLAWSAPGKSYILRQSLNGSPINVTEQNITVQPASPPANAYTNVANPALIWRGQAGHGYGELEDFDFFSFPGSTSSNDEPISMTVFGTGIGRIAINEIPPTIDVIALLARSVTPRWVGALTPFEQDPGHPGGGTNDGALLNRGETDVSVERLGDEPGATDAHLGTIDGATGGTVVEER